VCREVLKIAMEAALCIQLNFTFLLVISTTAQMLVQKYSLLTQYLLSDFKAKIK
jgi:hypothetical protein